MTITGFPAKKKSEQQILLWVLTRVVCRTDTLDRAKKSQYVWGQLPGDSLYTLRVVGVLNGILRRVRRVIVITTGVRRPVSIEPTPSFLAERA